MDQDAPAKPREQKVTWLSPGALGLALTLELVAAAATGTCALGFSSKQVGSRQMPEKTREFRPQHFFSVLSSPLRPSILSLKPGQDSQHTVDAEHRAIQERLLF